MSKFAAYAPARPPMPRYDALEVAAATSDDLPAVAAIAAEREGTTVERELSRARAFLAHCDAEGRGLFLVARVGGRVVGYGRAAQLEPSPGADGACMPSGWYLIGIVVDPAHRRRGVGSALVARRLEWIAAREPRAYYLANAGNPATIDLHRQFGFVEHTRDVDFPGVTFEGGVGVLFEVALPSASGAA